MQEYTLLELTFSFRSVAIGTLYVQITISPIFLMQNAFVFELSSFQN